MKPTDVIALPAPLTAADCNLQDFAFMPLDVARLRDSDLAAYQTPEACWAAVLLWAAAWHQVPAASLPDDDRFLAKAAGYGRVVKEWLPVREGALHGWIKCADGRLYHPVVAEKANESWHKKLHYLWEKECDRIRKANKKREQEGAQPLAFPPEPKPHSIRIPAESGGIPPESHHVSGGNTAGFQGANLPGVAPQGPGAPNTAQELSGEQGAQPPKTDADAFPPESVGIPPERPLNSAGKQIYSAGIPPENALKGQGQGQGELTSKPTTPDGVVVASQAGNLSTSPPQPAARPECPHQQIIALYHELLPMCPQVRDWTPARQQQLRARWNEDPQRQNLDYWRKFFGYVKTCGFLVGRGVGDRPFLADLEWLTKSKNFTKIREGKYE